MRVYRPSPSSRNSAERFAPRQVTRASLVSRYRRLGLMSILTLGVIASFSAQLIIANSFATRGSDIVAYEQKRVTLQKEIETLERQATHLQSLDRIRSEAVKSGFAYRPNGFAHVSRPQLALLVSSPEPLE